MRTLFLLFIHFISVFSKNSNSDIPVFIALYQRNIDVLESKLLDISNPLSTNYGKWMTYQEISNTINPPITDQQNVIGWLESYNISNINNYGDSIKFTAKRETVKELFKIKNNELRLFGYIIPEHLRYIIEFVEMDSKKINKISKINKKNAHETTDDRYFGKESLVSLYNVPSGKLNNSVSAASIEYQGLSGFYVSDLTLLQQANNQSINNKTIIIGDNDYYDTESELDIQLMSQAGNDAKLWFWDSPNWLFSFAIDFFNSEDIPDIISMSWGWAEDDQCNIIDCINITSQQYVKRVNNEYLKITLRGTTIVVASGDAGAPGRTNEGCDSGRPINPVFPGSSPYVLTVGATYVPLDNTTLNFTTPLCRNNTCITSKNEKSIQYNSVGWTAGGGFDIYHNSTPVWQKEAVDAYLNSGTKLPNEKNFNRNGRAYPDVSAVGHSCPVYIDGTLITADGTSCSSPVVAGLLTYINKLVWDTKKTKLGFVNPLLYHIHSKCDDCFQDITEGYNWCTEDGCCENTTDYGFKAIKGYDPVSGLGTLNVGRILDFLKSN
jgi:tripeptidyl-peptidase I